jgi:hypothetical protein
MFQSLPLFSRIKLEVSPSNDNVVQADVLGVLTTSKVMRWRGCRQAFSRARSSDSVCHKGNDK